MAGTGTARIGHRIRAGARERDTQKQKQGLHVSFSFT
jgi:hypothetical protein